MGATALTPLEVKRNAYTVSTAANTFKAGDATDGFTIDVTGAADHKLLILVVNGESATAKKVTIKKGNGIQAAAADLVSADIAAGSYAYLVVESGAYANVSGTNKGLLVGTVGSVNVSVAAFLLP